MDLLISTDIAVRDNPAIESLDPNVTTAAPNPVTGLAYWEILLTFKGPAGWLIGGTAYLSGVVLDIMLLIMVICSMPFVRRGGHFQVKIKLTSIQFSTLNFFI